MKRLSGRSGGLAQTPSLRSSAMEPNLLNAAHHDNPIRHCMLFSSWDLLGILITNTGGEGFVRLTFKMKTLAQHSWGKRLGTQPGGSAPRLRGKRSRGFKIEIVLCSRSGPHWDNPDEREHSRFFNTNTPGIFPLSQSLSPAVCSRGRKQSITF